MGYTFSKSQTWVKFSPDNEVLSIKNGFTKPASVTPQDCTKLSLTKGNISCEKLEYRLSGRKKTIVLYSSDYTADVAWAKYTKKYLQSLETKAVHAANLVVDQINQTSSEQKYNDRSAKT